MLSNLVGTFVGILLAVVFLFLAAGCMPPGQQSSPLALPTAAQSVQTPPPAAVFDSVLPTPVLTTALPITSPNTPATPPGAPTEQPSVESPQPPVDIDDVPRPPAQMARFDLARRLRVDTEWIEVVEETTRTPIQEDLACLKGNVAGGESWANPEEITRITLAYKNKIYHYVAVGDLIVFCEE